MRLRIVAALLGGGVPALVATAAWWLGVPLVVAVAGVGVPIGAVLAAVLAARALRPGWALLVVVVALGAPLLVATVLALGSSGGGLDRLVVGFAIVAGYAVLLATPVTLPTALVAALLLRRAGRMPARRAMRHVLLLAAITATAGGLTLAVAVGPLAGPAADAGLGPVDWEARSAAVRLELAIENRTPRDRYVEVLAELDDGSSGVGFGVGPCETVVNRLNLESALWSIRDLDGPEAGYEMDIETDGRLLATADDAPGTDPVLLVVIGPGDAAASAAVDRLPAAGGLDPETCH